MKAIERGQNVVFSVGDRVAVRWVGAFDPAGLDRPHGVVGILRDASGVFVLELCGRCYLEGGGPCYQHAGGMRGDT